MKTENKQVNVETTEPVTESTTGNVPEATENHNAIACAPECEKVEKAIRESVYVSVGLGVVPVSLFNFTTIAANNLNLVRKLSNLYGVEFKENDAKKIVVAVTSAGVGTVFTPVVGALLAGIPLIGLPLLVGTLPALSGMTTYAVGRMFAAHFERGGNFISANVNEMKEDFSAAYKNSRQKIGDIIAGKKEEEPANA